MTSCGILQPDLELFLRKGHIHVKNETYLFTVR